MRYIGQEIKKALCNPFFVLAVLLQVLLLYDGAREDWVNPQTAGAFYLFNVAKTLGSAQLFIPLIASLPHAMSYASEKRSGFLVLSYYRTGKTNYIAGKILSVLISGGLALGLGTLLYAGACILLSPAVTEASNDWRAYQDGTWMAPYCEAAFGRPYIFLSVMMDASTGVLWSSVTLLFSVLVAHPIFALIASQCFFMVVVSSPVLRSIFNPMIPADLSAYYSKTPTPGVLLAQEGLFLTVVLLLTCLLFIYQLNHVSFSRGHGRSRTSPLHRLMAHIKIPRTALYFALALLIARPILFGLYSITTGETLIYLMGGALYHSVSSFAETAQWFLLLIPCMLMISMYMAQELSPRLYLSLHRHGSGGRWYGSMLRESLLPCLGYILLQYAWIIIFCALTGRTGDSALVYLDYGQVNYTPYIRWILPVLLAHILMITTLQLGLTLWTGNSLYPMLGVLFMLILSSWVGHGLHNPSSSYYIGNWGMVVRSDIAGELQITPGTMVLIQLAASALFGFLGYWRAKHYHHINIAR